jgi:hypothetical protein
MTLSADFTLDNLLRILGDRGCRRVYAKRLAANDNSKNQVYFGGGFQALNVMPYGEVVSDGIGGRARFKAPVAFWWLDEDGNVSPAPGAQLILYPKYPEVRFSGFLGGSHGAPAKIMASRDIGRVLVFGVTQDERILGWAGNASSAVAKGLEELDRLGSLRAMGVFREVPLKPTHGGRQVEVILLSELGRIHRLGWILAKRLRKDGTTVDCRGLNCGGSTLETELGVAANSIAEPDYLGYEVKQHNVPDFRKPTGGGAITLMTPEPTGGLYRDQGVEAFVRTYGYPDKLGRPDRLNFGGIYRSGSRVDSTGLRLALLGWDTEAGRITDDGGGVALLDDSGVIAALWPFAGLISHWKKKHNRAVYVPSMRADQAPLRYRYGDLVRIGEGADFLRVIHAFAAGVVYYDPGIKIEHSSGIPVIKRRSQFRVRSSDVRSLYKSMRTVGVL